MVVWVTNKPAFHSFVCKTLFKRWKVKYLATWYWLKVWPGLVFAQTSAFNNIYQQKTSFTIFDLPTIQVSTQGDMVMPLHSEHRKPYGTVPFHSALFLSWLLYARHSSSLHHPIFMVEPFIIGYFNPPHPEQHAGAGEKN